ncbi:MAG: 5'-3' exonuclease H3TH domain-containing protein [Candidatus Pacebacteria bacterium]|nr:5'-3' exonuclease H3TH domain-containing protein [Candidatus Paceibacterota bacterium]
MEDKKRLIIIDGNAIIHRAYHALPPLATKKGELVNAVYGFLSFFLKSMKEFKPDFIIAAFDFPAETFRHVKYKLYKANRPKAPDNLYEQIPKVKEILKELNIQVFEQKGYEADDIIGTISKKAPKKQIFPELETIILTGDLDALQLVDRYTKVYVLKKGINEAVLYDEKRVKERYNDLAPDKLVDFKALRGDPSDNIPGVYGIGEKTAISLIKEFNSLDNLYKEIEENTEKSKTINASVRKKLIDYKDQAFVSKMLAEIRCDALVDFELETFKFGDYSRDKIKEIFERFEFKSLINRLPEPEKENKTEEKNKNNLSLW